jgi:putative ABC transport system permease protein
VIAPGFVLKLAWREGRASRRRLALLVAAVAVGVAALVAINSFTASLRDSIRRQARVLLGADLALSTAAPFSPRAEEIIREIAASSGARGAARIARVTSFGAMSYVARTSGARLVQVWAVEPGYPFYGAIETAPPGVWSRLEQTRGVLVEPSLLSMLGAEVGDTLALGDARLPIRGTVVDVPGDVGIRSALGPRVFIPASTLGETGLLAFGSRARYEAFLELPAEGDAQRLADRHRPALGAERVNVRTVSEDQRRLDQTLSRQGRFLGLVALIALLLGGLGIASAIHVFIKRKIETVAVLRCLGASAGQIVAAYLLQAAAMGLAGSLIGAGAGTAVQLALPGLLGEFLPVDVRVAPRAGAIAGGVGLGLWVAVLFTLPPLLAVRRVSPLVVLRRDYEPPVRGGRDRARLLAVLGVGASVVALAALQAASIPAGLAFAGGIGAALGLLWLAAFLLTRTLRRRFPSRLPYVWRQGLANLHRPANQTVLVVLALGFGAFLLGALVLVQHNLLRDLSVDRAERPNFVLFDIQPDQRGRVEAELRGAGLVPSDPVPIVPMRIASLKGATTSSLLGAKATEEQMRGRWALRREYRSTYRDRLVASERQVAGEWWAPGEWRGAGAPSPVPISMEAGVARELGLVVGDEVVWDVQGLAIATRVASLREVDFFRFEPNFFVVFPQGPLEAAPQTYVTLSRADDPLLRAQLQRRIAEAMPNVSALDLSQVQQAVEAIVARVALAIRFMALFSLGAGALVLMGAVAASRYQRSREGALLKALGATRAQVLRILCAEYLSLGVLASACALVLATAGGWALTRFSFEARFELPWLPLLGLGMGVVALTVLVGLSGSREVSRRTAVEVLRAE